MGKEKKEGRKTKLQFECYPQKRGTYIGRTEEAVTTDESALGR